MKTILTPKDQEAKTYGLEDLVLIRDLPTEAHQVDVWIPLLPTDEHQRVMGVEVDSPFPLPLRHEREFGNPMLHGVAFALFPREISLGVRYQVIRQPLHLDLDPAKAGWVTGRREPFHRFLLPERYVRVDDEMRRHAQELVKGEENPLTQAKTLYDHVVGYMRYDATQQSWKGSTDHALTCQVGNCNDIHALYLSLARAIGIPSRLVMGFALEAPTPEQCEVCGYHCWVEAYIGGLGWIPVDASCACKYGHAGFGTLDLNHVAFSRGRDLLLEPPQRGDRLLYFASAYVEVDGVHHEGVERRLTFKDM